MAITTVRCHVLQANVIRVTDFEGKTTRLICPEYEEKSGLSRLRNDALSGGPLSQLLARASEETLSARFARCEWS